MHAVVCVGGKAEVVAGLEQGVLQPFHENRWELGHSATDFARWCKTDEPYDIENSWVSHT